MDPCVKEKEINGLVKEMARVQTENITLFKRVDFLETVYTSIRDLSSNVAVLAEQMKDTKSDVEYIRKEVDKIKEKPANNYNSVKLAIASAILAAIVTALVGKIV